MRHSLLAAALLTALVSGCKAEAPTSPAASSETANAAASQADARFAELSKRWLEGWLPLNPVSATQIGDHRFDAELDDLSPEGRQRALDFSKKMLAELDANDGALNGSFNLPRDSVLRATLGKDSQTPCEYRTAHSVTLWPLQVAEAEYISNPAAALGRLAASEPRAKAALRITLRSGTEIPFASLELDNLPLYLNGLDELPFRLYEQLLGNRIAVFARQPGRAALLAGEPFRPGFFAFGIKGIACRPYLHKEGVHPYFLVKIKGLHQIGTHTYM